MQNTTSKAEMTSAFKECLSICKEIMRVYRFEDDIAYGARLCYNDIKRQMAILGLQPEED